MKHLILILVLFCSLPLHAQVRKYYGRVTDKVGNGLPNALIEQKGRIGIRTCDSGGYFSFDGNTDTAKVSTLIFSADGYEDKEVAGVTLVDDAIFIVLKKIVDDTVGQLMPTDKATRALERNESFRITGMQHSIMLNEVEIPGRKRKVYKHVLGRKKLRHKSGAYMINGDEVAVALPADSTRKGILKEVFVYITAEGRPDSKFRVHVYAKDSVTTSPGFDITDSVVILHANKGDEWVSVDLSSKRIPVRDGIFISVEWLAGYGNNDELMHMEHFPGYCTQSTGNVNDGDYNGQVVGTSWDYGVRNIAHLSYHDSKDRWYTYNISFQNKGPIRTYHWGNPMIYGTYTYVKR